MSNSGCVGLSHMEYLRLWQSRKAIVEASLPNFCLKTSVFLKMVTQKRES